MSIANGACAKRCLLLAVASGRLADRPEMGVAEASSVLQPVTQTPVEGGIAWLAARFFDEYAAQTDSDLAGMSALAEEALLTHPWPGNVRELRNRVERAVALGLGPWLMPGDFFSEAPLTASDGAPLSSLEEARMAAERRHIRRSSVSPAIRSRRWSTSCCSGGHSSAGPPALPTSVRRARQR